MNARVILLAGPSGSGKTSLLRRGLRLALEEPERVRDWMERGCRPVSRRQCEAAIAEHIGSFAVPGNRADGVM